MFVQSMNTWEDKKGGFLFDRFFPAYLCTKLDIEFQGQLERQLVQDKNLQHPIPEVQREVPEWAQEVPNLPPEARCFFLFLNIFSVKNGENIPEMSFIQEVGDESLGHVGNLWKVMTGFSCKNHGPLVFKLRLWCKYSVLNTDTQVKLQFYNKTNKIQPWKLECKYGGAVRMERAFLYEISDMLCMLNCIYCMFKFWGWTLTSR